MDNVVRVDFTKKTLSRADEFLQELKGELMEEDIQEIIDSALDFSVYRDMDKDLKIIAEEYYRLLKIT